MSDYTFSAEVDDAPTNLSVGLVVITVIAVMGLLAMVADLMGGF